MKIVRFFQGIPRPVKACFLGFFTCLIAIAFYIAIGCPTLSLRQEFRRAEKANLVGPSKIVDRLDEADYHEYDDLIVGETEHGICFMGRSKYEVAGTGNKKNHRYQFNYREKTGNITVVTAPNFWGWSWDSHYDWALRLPVYIFTEHSNAASAKITLTVQGSHTKTVNGTPQTTNYSEVFTATAWAIEPGVLRCFVESSGGSSNTALAALSNVCTNNVFKEDDELWTEIPCTVELFDAEGNLIVREEIVLRTDCGMKDAT